MAQVAYLDLAVQGLVPHPQTEVDIDASPPNDRQSCGRCATSILPLLGNYLELSRHQSPWLVLVEQNRVESALIQWHKRASKLLNSTRV